MSDPEGEKLFDAAYGGRESEVSSLLRDYPEINVNWTDIAQLTPLHSASYNGHVEVVKLLLAHSNINVNLTNASGRTPLSLGCQFGQVSVVELLLRDLVSMPHSGTRAALHCGAHLVMGSMT